MSCRCSGKGKFFKEKRGIIVSNMTLMPMVIEREGYGLRFPSPERPHYYVQRFN